MLAVLTIDDAPARTLDGIASCRKPLSTTCRAMIPVIASTCAPTATAATWNSRPRLAATTSSPAVMMTAGFRSRSANLPPIQDPP